jgi:hypothetical protein
MRKNKSKVLFVESSIRQKVRSIFPVVQYRIASPYQNGAIVVCLRKTNIRNEIKVSINRNGLLNMQTKKVSEPTFLHQIKRCFVILFGLRAQVNMAFIFEINTNLNENHNEMS